MLFKLPTATHSKAAERVVRPENLSIDWIRPLATPYLRGYRAVAERRGSLRGYWFNSPSVAAPQKLGFFVGYLSGSRELEHLNPERPECLVCACVGPVGGPLHRRLVARPESLLRKTFDYIRWLTHRPPRFVFHAGESAVMVRHQTMRDWPREKYEHFSRNFFIETLAWLVRSGLVRRLLQEVDSAGERLAKAQHSPKKPRSAQVKDRRRRTQSGVSRKPRSR